jgi:DNA-binding LacI/PurR family transcriptional regulator
VRIRGVDIGRTAAELALAAIADSGAKPRTVTFAPELVVRASSGRSPH